MNVVLISRDHRLGAILTMALPSPEGLTLLDSPAEVPDPREAVIDAVVLDLPADSRRDAYQELRQRYEGRVLVPVDNAKDTNGWPPDSKRRFLVRPFQVADLIAGVQEPEETSVAERAARYRRLFRWNRQHVPAFPDISAPPAAEQPPPAAETSQRPLDGEAAPPPAARAVDLEAAAAEDGAEDEEPVVVAAEDEQRVEAAAEEQRFGAEDEDEESLVVAASEDEDDAEDEESLVVAADEDEASFAAETEDGDSDELTEAITAEDAEEAASAEGEDDEAPEAAAAEDERLDDESRTEAAAEDSDAEAETQEFLALDAEDDEQAEAEAEEPPEAEADEQAEAETEEERSVAAAVEAALREELDLAEGPPGQEPAPARSPAPPLPVQAGVAMAKAVALQQWLEAEEARRASGRRRRVLANIAAGVVLLLVGVGIGMALGSEEPQQVSPPATPQPVVQIRNAPPPAACTQAMDNADAVISYLVAKIRDERLSESIQDYGANARACRRSGGNP